MEKKSFLDKCTVECTVARWTPVTKFSLTSVGKAIDPVVEVIMGEHYPEVKIGYITDKGIKYYTKTLDIKCWGYINIGLKTTADNVIIEQYIESNGDRKRTVFTAFIKKQTSKK